MYKKSYSALFLLLIYSCVNAQKFTPDTSKSGNLFRAAKFMKGFANGVYDTLPPITAVIPSTSGVSNVGAQIYLTSDSSKYDWTGFNWFTYAKKGSDWSVKGNSGTTAGTNFIGTTDNVAFVIKTNNTERARFLSNGNFGIGTLVPTKKLELVGSDALINTITVGRGNNDITTNTVAGLSALSLNTTGNNNTGIGFGSLQVNTTGSDNTAIGKSAIQVNTTGASNTAIGAGALTFNITGSRNAVVGAECLVNNISGNSNCAMGFGSMFTNTIGYQNVSIGDSALYTSNSFNNTAIGFEALASDTLGESNTAVGMRSLFNNRMGAYNVGIGDSALINITNGDNNIGIGFNSGNGVTTGNDNVFIGSFSSPLGAATSTNVIINDGASNLAYKKDASGNVTIPVQIINNDTTVNKILVQNTSTGAVKLSNWNQSYSSFSGTLDFPSITAGNFEQLTLSATGASDGDVISLGVVNAAYTGGLIYTAWVSAVNTVTIQVFNSTGLAIDPPSSVFKVKILK